MHVVVFLCAFYAKYICIYEIFFVPLHPDCIIKTVVSLIHKIGLFGKVCLGSFFVGVFVHLRNKAR